MKDEKKTGGCTIYLNRKEQILLNDILYNDVELFEVDEKKKDKERLIGKISYKIFKNYKKSQL